MVQPGSVTRRQRDPKIHSPGRYGEGKGKGMEMGLNEKKTAAMS